MAIARKNIKSEDDFLKVGPDATATFDSPPSNPTEHASSENLRAAEVDDELEDEEEDSEEEDFDDQNGEQEDVEDEEYDDEMDDDDEDDEEEEEEDHDLATGPKAPSVYRKV